MSDKLTADLRALAQRLEAGGALTREEGLTLLSMLDKAQEDLRNAVSTVNQLHRIITETTRAYQRHVLGETPNPLGLDEVLRKHHGDDAWMELEAYERLRRRR